MALTATTLAGALGVGDTIVNLTSGTSVAVGVLLQVDSEMMRVDAATSSTTQWLVARGQAGTAQVAHNILAIAIHGPAADFNADLRTTRNVVAYGAAGAIAIPSKDSLILLNSGAASAMTLADPSLADEGRQLTIMANTAHAYTVSNAAGSGFNTGGAAADIGTYGGAKGDNMVLVARGGDWFVVTKTNVTLA
jgi:hypothetical protein